MASKRRNTFYLKKKRETCNLLSFTLIVDGIQGRIEDQNNKVGSAIRLGNEWWSGGVEEWWSGGVAGWLSVGFEMPSVDRGPWDPFASDSDTDSDPDLDDTPYFPPAKRPPLKMHNLSPDAERVFTTVTQTIQQLRAQPTDADNILASYFSIFDDITEDRNLSDTAAWAIVHNGTRFPNTMYASMALVNFMARLPAGNLFMPLFLSQVRTELEESIERLDETDPDLLLVVGEYLATLLECMTLERYYESSMPKRMLINFLESTMRNVNLSAVTARVLMTPGGQNLVDQAPRFHRGVTLRLYDRYRRNLLTPAAVKLVCYAVGCYPQYGPFNIPKDDDE
ncbi:hypothetical protein AAG570_013081 [Ranatra chinensis]|uniref:Uncharacterized protein n=1 Tax=Ranatra chinensis TaxID=642074 RepID=A0ABD0YFS4_9HEMI